MKTNNLIENVTIKFCLKSGVGEKVIANVTNSIVLKKTRQHWMYKYIPFILKKTLSHMIELKTNKHFHKYNISYSWDTVFFYSHQNYSIESTVKFGNNL